MADLNDLPITSITEMSTDEAIELLRQVRLARRVPTKAPRTPAMERKAKAKALPTLSAEDALNLLKTLGEL